MRWQALQQVRNLRYQLTFKWQGRCCPEDYRRYVPDCPVSMLIAGTQALLGNASALKLKGHLLILMSSETSYTPYVALMYLCI